jgi:hypothetical protein
MKHYSLDPYGAHGMTQQHLMRCIVAGNAISLGLFFLHTCQLFLTAVQIIACSNKEGPPGDGCTLKHHLFDPFDGGHGMVQQLLCRDTRIVSSIVYTSD